MLSKVVNINFKKVKINVTTYIYIYIYIYTSLFSFAGVVRHISTYSRNSSQLLCRCLHMLPHIYIYFFIFFCWSCQTFLHIQEIHHNYCVDVCICYHIYINTSLFSFAGVVRHISTYSRNSSQLLCRCLHMLPHIYIYIYINTSLFSFAGVVRHISTYSRNSSQLLCRCLHMLPHIYIYIYILLYFLLLELSDISTYSRNSSQLLCRCLYMLPHIIFLLFLVLISIHVVLNSALLVLRSRRPTVSNTLFT